MKNEAGTDKKGEALPPENSYAPQRIIGKLYSFSSIINVANGTVLLLYAILSYGVLSYITQHELHTPTFLITFFRGGSCAAPVIGLIAVIHFVLAGHRPKIIKRWEENNCFKYLFLMETMLVIILLILICVACVELMGAWTVGD